MSYWSNSKILPPKYYWQVLQEYQPVVHMVLRLRTNSSDVALLALLFGCCGCASLHICTASIGARAQCPL